MERASRRRGFTLIEVLIVVIIIAILAALIIPRFMGQTKKAEIAEAMQMLGAIDRAAVAAHALNPDLQGRFTDLTMIGLRNPPASSKWGYVYDVAMEGFPDSVCPSAFYPGYVGDYGIQLHDHPEGKYWKCIGELNEVKDSSGRVIGCEFP